MAFPNDAMTADEELILSLHPHVLYMWRSGLALLGALIVSVLLMQTGFDPLTYLGALAILGSLIWFLVQFAQWGTTWFVLTSDRVLYRSGLVSKRGTEIPLEGISAVLFSQRVLERIFGLGDITIQSSAAQGDAVFNDIRRPSLVQKRIYEEINARQDRQARRLGGYAAPHLAAPAPAPNAADQISQLAALRDAGHISEAEFQEKKAELLRRM